MSPKHNEFKKTDRRQNPGKSKISFFLSCFLTPLFTALLFFPGCGPKYTYPADKVPESVEKICKKEYKIENIEVRVVGKTIGTLFYIDDILDEKGQIPKEVHEKMGKIIQVMTRVALSTDLPLDFCQVIVRDSKDGNELTITRSIEDAKRANADAIGIEESINRTLFGQSRYLEKDPKKKKFILKDVKLENFLAEQIVQRVRFGFSHDAKEASVEDMTSQPFVLVDGLYEKTEENRGFRFSILSMKAEDPKETVLNVFKTIHQVLIGYKFNNFDQIEILDYLNRQKLVVDYQTMQDYQNKKIKDQQILDMCLKESQSIQEAFKLFGFNLPSNTSDSTDTGIIAAATP